MSINGLANMIDLTRPLATGAQIGLQIAQQAQAQRALDEQLRARAAAEQMAARQFAAEQEQQAFANNLNLRRADQADAAFGLSVDRENRIASQARQATDIASRERDAATMFALNSGLFSTPDGGLDTGAMATFRELSPVMQRQQIDVAMATQRQQQKAAADRERLRPTFIEIDRRMNDLTNNTMLSPETTQRQMDELRYVKAGLESGQFNSIAAGQKEWRSLEPQMRQSILPSLTAMYPHADQKVLGGIDAMYQQTGRVMDTPPVSVSGREREQSVTKSAAYQDLAEQFRILSTQIPTGDSRTMDEYKPLIQQRQAVGNQMMQLLQQSQRPDERFGSGDNTMAQPAAAPPNGTARQPGPSRLAAVNILAKHGITLPAGMSFGDAVRMRLIPPEVVAEINQARFPGMSMPSAEPPRVPDFVPGR